MRNNKDNIYSKNFNQSYFYADKEDQEFVCFYSNEKKYKSGKKYNLFELGSVLNTLAELSGCINKEIKEKLSINKNDIVVIKQWDSFSKRFMILTPKQTAKDNDLIKLEKSFLSKDYSNKFFKQKFYNENI